MDEERELYHSSVVSTLCVYVHVWISGFFVLVYWHPGLFVPVCFVSLLEVFHYVREIRRAENGLCSF